MLDHKELKSAIQSGLSRFDFQIQETSLQDGWIIYIAATDWLSTIQCLRNDRLMGFDQLTLLMARNVDGGKVELIAEMKSEKTIERLSIRIKTNKNDCIESLASIWKYLKRYEQEIFDKFQINIGGTA